MRFKAVIGLGVAAAALATLGLAGTASASSVTLYYNSGYQGESVTFYGNVPNLGVYSFPSKGSVKNNAASAWNNDYNTVSIWYNSNYAGVRDVIAGYSGSGNRLVNTYNEDASISFS
ncbi:hypothetical protein C7C46_21735 [Streptomyces tateyamensis]|uniref:Beta/gamma crystallin 'Greek key' domain-containing protein n=1 Tax=Streptomyces tateyamensis TaxID=565073 RepID=A0A2V4NY81_9ACTN|nr:peptidase inhibitor family I36 protein [Streptomyces tateyamensis]PYC76805.1 hypothetical protein C7C46_21735 [Streptomyces tateyamensis]